MIGNSIQENAAGIVTLIVGVALSVVILIFMGSLSGEMYSATEPTIEGFTDSDTVTVSEDFNDDTLGTDPSESWYSYSEDGWEFANVYGSD